MVITRRRIVHVVAVVALATAACGGGNDGAPSVPTATTPQPLPATTSAPPVAVTTSATSQVPSTVAPPTTDQPTSQVPPTTVAPSPPTTEQGPLRIKVDIYDGVADTEERVVVARGDEIELIVTSDVPNEVHVHGYDYKADVEPGSPAVIIFVADLPGIYEVELEVGGLVLFELEVR